MTREWKYYDFLVIRILREEWQAADKKLKIIGSLVTKLPNFRNP
jgi:hypothetical protein